MFLARARARSFVEWPDGLLTLVSLVPTVLQRDRDFESLPTLELGWALGWLGGVNNVVHIMIVVRGHSDESTSLRVNGESDGRNLASVARPGSHHFRGAFAIVVEGFCVEVEMRGVTQSSETRSVKKRQTSTG